MDNNGVLLLVAVACLLGNCTGLDNTIDINSIERRLDKLESKEGEINPPSSCQQSHQQ
jgi:hypothetical protein